MGKRFLDRCKFGVASAPGTGNISVGAALPGFYRTPAQAGLLDGETISGLIQDGFGNVELSDLLYTSATTSFARTVIVSSAGGTTKLDLSADALISSVESARDRAAQSSIQSSVADMLAISSDLLVEGALIWVASFYGDGNGGGGPFITTKTTPIFAVDNGRVFQVGDWYFVRNDISGNVFYLDWWGPEDNAAGMYAGTNTDAQPKIQAAIEACVIPSGGPAGMCVIRVSVARQYCIGNTLHFYQYIGVRFGVESAMTGDPPTTTLLTWIGASEGTMVWFEQSQGCTFEGLSLHLGSADRGILCDGYSSGRITSNITIDNCQINVTVDSNHPDDATFPYCISIAETTTNNGEFMHLTNNRMFGGGGVSSPYADEDWTMYGTGIRYGGSFNGHGHTSFNNTMSNLYIGINCLEGGFHSTKDNFSVVRYGLKMNDAVYPSILEFADFEGQQQMIYINVANSTFTVTHCRLDGGGFSTSGKGLIEIGGGAGDIAFEYNSFDVAPTAGSWYYDLNSASSNLKLLLLHNHYAFIEDKTQYIRYGNSTGYYTRILDDIGDIYATGIYQYGYPGAGTAAMADFATNLQGLAVGPFNLNIDMNGNVSPIYPIETLTPGGNITVLGNITPNFALSGEFLSGELTLLTTATGATWTTSTDGNIARVCAPANGQAVKFTLANGKWYPSI